jgi:phosphatidylserine/phosphatidylglycerophosphate/cardiolipin synthase-like enzyme
MTRVTIKPLGALAAVLALCSIGGPAAASSAQDKIFVEPDEHGATVLGAIKRARHTIDIVIYQFGGPNVVGQPGAPGALMRAVARGVDVRIMVNGQFFDPNCTAATPQKKCLHNPNFAPIRATIASLRYAARKAGPNAGSVSVGFANNNFQITHQKTMLIDAADPNTGRPLAADRLPPSAKALVMTLNLQAGYPNAWGSASVTHPRAGCSAPCNEFTARDFGLVVTQPALVSRIEHVFFSDLHCGSVPPSTVPSRTNTNHLRTTAGPDTWSNGSTRPRPARKPVYPFGVYPDAIPPAWKIQGNARARQLGLINRARKSLEVYNEEMADPQIVAALTAAATRLGPGAVRVVMTESSSWATAFDTLTQAGARIMVFPAASDVLYIHAKAIVADAQTAFVGSENISTASLDDNRELGLMLSSKPHPGPGYLPDSKAIATIRRTFNSDFTNPAAQPWPVSSHRLGRQPPRSPAHGQRSNANGNYPMRCGPVFSYKPRRPRAIRARKATAERAAASR